MIRNFKVIVSAAFEDFFNENGFTFHESMALDAGNKSISIYKSSRCKLAFYRSQRDGEINCLIGKPDTDNSTKDREYWACIKSLLSRKKEPTINELLLEIPDKPRSDEEQIREIYDFLQENFHIVQKNFESTGSQI